MLVCTECGQRQPFRRLPLFSLTGPSGTGKSTVCRQLTGALGDRVVVLEQDVLWSPRLAGDVPAFRALWLRTIGMIHQSGRSVVLCGTVAPVEFERCAERAFVGDVHYLALVCDPDVLASRLRSRPAWRGWDEARVAEALAFNDWIRSGGAGVTELVDTTSAPPADTVAAVAAWVRRGLPADCP